MILSEMIGPVTKVDDFLVFPWAWTHEVYRMEDVNILLSAEKDHFTEMTLSPEALLYEVQIIESLREIRMEVIASADAAR